MPDNLRMVESIEERTRVNDYLMTLVSTALEQKELAGLSAMLRHISEAVHAYGCILWEVAPGTDLQSTPPQGRLYVLAEWFRDGHVFAKHDMPITESVNGAVIISGVAENIPDIRRDERAYSNQANRRTIDAMKLQTMCSVPITFSDSGNSKGTLSLYRNTPVPFNEEEFLRVKEMARLVPDLYKAIRDKVSQNLIHSVNEILHKADLRSSGHLSSPKDMKDVLQQVCMQVANTFQCIETSVFMEDRFEAAGEYQLVGTTWPSWSQVKKDSYLAHPNEGITGWVLANNRPVRIFNLGDFERDAESIRLEYEGLNWKDSLDIKATARKLLKLDKNVRLPPLSFMAAPIFRGGKVLGVIRCCTARNVPYYFANRELNLLKLVSIQISRFWSNWLIQREIDIEKRTWEALVNGVSQLNSFVQQELKADAPNEKHVFKEVLSVAHSVITGADISDVRLYDPETRELYFAATYGKAWTEGGNAASEARLKRRFSVNEVNSLSPIGVRVFHSGKAMSVFNAEGRGYKSTTFPQTKRIIVAPIRAQNKVIGVLDLRGTGGKAFPTYAVRVAEILGQQLGLYQYLIKIIRELNQAATDRKNREKERLQTNEDLAHQLRGPIIQAHARIQGILDDNRSVNDRLHAHLLPIRGLIAKAKRVTMSTGLFAELAREHTIQIDPNRLRQLKYDLVVKMLIEAAMDNELMIDPYRRIKFHVHRESFEVLNTLSISADPDLLEQAVKCLLDNAGKYSFAGTAVDISGGGAANQSFFISVVNKGMSIKQHEISLAKQRLWRSEQATWTTGEGSGIGLWVVDHIMKAHKGELLITPTTFEGVTQIKLIFPVAK